MSYTLSEINDQLAHLALLREELDLTKRTVKERQEYLFESDPYYVAMTDNLVKVALQVDELEAELRTWAIDQANTLGTKHPHPALGIRVSMTPAYKVPDAVKYVMEHEHTELLTINAKAFEKLASVIQLDFVTWVPKVTATIQQDLSNYIPDPPPTDDVQI